MAESPSAPFVPALPRSGGDVASGGRHRLRRLTKRREYLAANRGRRAHMPGFVLLVHPRDDGDPMPGLGITASRKVGNAVHRNRVKRRFRALAAAILPDHGIAGADHVLIARAAAFDRDFATMGDELRAALARLARPGRTAR